MPLIRDHAIVLKRLDYSESSQILVAFTRSHGKVRLIAKGARRSTKKRFSPGIDLLEAGQAALSVRTPRQNTLATLTEWTQRHTFWGLRERLDSLNAAQYAADVTAALTEDWDPHPRLYDALEKTLGDLADHLDVLPVLVTFQRALLDGTGLLPRLDQCVVCGRGLESTPDIYFSSFEGGLICRDCEAPRVEKRLVTVSRAALRKRSLSTPADLAGAFDLFNYHIAHLMGRTPAAGPWLLDLARRRLT